MDWVDRAELPACQLKAVMFPEKFLKKTPPGALRRAV